MKAAAMDPESLSAFEELAAEASLNPGRMIAHAVSGRMQVSIFIDGKLAETIVDDAGKRLRAQMLAFDAGDLLMVLAGRAHQAKRADEAEARNAAVIDVMRSMDDTRGKLVNAAWVAKAQLGFVIEELRVALGLPGEWRDGEAPEDPRVDPEVADDIRGQLEVGSFRYLGENPANSVDEEPCLAGDDHPRRVAKRAELGATLMGMARERLEWERVIYTQTRPPQPSMGLDAAVIICRQARAINVWRDGGEG